MAGCASATHLGGDADYPHAVTGHVTICEASREHWQAAGELKWIWDDEDGLSPQSSRSDFVDTYADWIEAHRGSHTCWVALDDDEVVGMAFLVRTGRPPTTSAPDRFVAEIQSVYVTASHRGAGIGGQLVAVLMAHARTCGADRMIVHSRPRSLPVYRRAGFTAVELLLEHDFSS